MRPRPFLDPTALEALTRDHDTAAERNYRRAKEFRWAYLDTCAPDAGEGAPR